MKSLLVSGALLLAAHLAPAQILTPVKWAYAARRTSPTEATVYLKATLDEGWHIYSQTVQKGGPVKTSFVFAPAKTYALVGATEEPKPTTQFEPVFGMPVSYFAGSVVFQQKVKLSGKGPVTIKGTLRYMTCNDTKCLPPDEVAFSIPVK